MSELTIGLVLPDVLGTYGDDGNALVLRQRARMRGLSAEIHKITLGTPVPETLDVYTVGGGEDVAQLLAAEHLISDSGLVRAAQAGRPILAICAGLQVLGRSFRASGKVVDGLGLLDATTGSLTKRMIGEIVSEPLLPGVNEPLTGFANHMGSTILGADAQPLGRLTKGTGNCDEGEQVSYEGAMQGSVISTYMHGPALARNPQLADYLLAQAMGTTVEGLPPLEGRFASQLNGEVAQLRRERLQ